jgi:hypothetical protein
MRWLSALVLFTLLAPLGAVAGPSITDTPIPGIEGRWRLADSGRGAIPDETSLRVVHHFFPGGVWIGVTWKAGKLTILEGSWSHELETLILKSATGPVPGSAWLPDDVVNRFLAGKGEIDPAYRWTAGTELPATFDGGGRLVLQGSGANDGSLAFVRIADPAPADLAGEWTGKKKRSMKIGSDGDVESSRRVFGKSVTVKGTWRLDGGRLTIAPASGGDPDVAGLVYVAGADIGAETDRLILLRPQMKAETYERPAKRKKVEKPVAAGVVGSWVARGEDGEVEITIKADGTYVSVMRSAGEVESSGGTWKVVDGAMLIHDDEDGPMRVPYEIIEGNVLKLVIAGDTLVMMRKGTETVVDDDTPGGNYPKGLLGFWLARDATGEISLQLAAGRFTMKARNAMQSWVYSGPWTHQEGLITGRDENSGQPVNLPYRLVTATQLMITINGVQVILVKQG